ncbi:sensor histidine kinase [Paenibacillus alkalitolerans]|uniref:sensor histidine kinase n=1 Tax=Paenibacillus alkalitolerans TaxID=2799335 RepID=UPI0018F7BC24|nr:ATP-binding protein [Paenibacillus alkalitolerans]
MDTRWKNRSLLVAWALLFTMGINGILNLLTDGSTYIKKDYFQTQKFENQLAQFIDYLSVFELNYIPKEEAKKLITVNDWEIEQYRYRNGDLPQQISEIKGRFDHLIEDAIASNNRDEADLYIAERDRKIEEITNIFKSDEYVKAIIIKEKEQKIDEQYQEQESRGSEFMKYRSAFKYVLRDIATGKVFTNISADDGANPVLKREDMLFVRSYPSLSAEGRAYRYIYDEMNLFTRKAGVFEGEIGVAESASASSYVMSSYNDFTKRRTAFFIYTVISILALIGSIQLYRRYPVAEMTSVTNIQPYYNRIPLDVRVIVLIFSTVIAFAFLFEGDEALYYEDAYTVLIESLYHLVFSTLFLSLVLIQGRLLKGGFSGAWRKALLYRGYQRLKTAFMIKSVAAQVFILMFIMFAFGAGLAFAIVEPEVFIVYVPLLLAVGVPILLFIIKRAGYFNQIVHISSDSARGNFEQDVPVKGKSALAKLAGNINTLKYGVKTSQKEQAKSERLKTELITNVSHDLRTPLTSIITYTKLLKNKDLSEADRDAFMEIIDRKSQRLKVLIDDLFEATKMASGQIQLVKEKIDLVQLLQQALAENNEAIKESALQFRVSTPDMPVIALVDGQKLWRVFDNLIGNCLKYSLENTRVYISLKTMQDRAVITFKNVTKYELSENIDELFERFKRGDASRHTEGSGLGLAIAKSIIDLHEGNLEMDIDGDLFKVTVTLKTENN